MLVQKELPQVEEIRKTKRKRRSEIL